MRKIEDPISHFLSKVDKGAPDECWPWMGNVNPSGYGTFWFNSKAVRAHRLAWKIAFSRNDPIPHGLVVMHKCDNTKCCNPRHLVLGTQADNNKDRAEKGRTKTLMQPGEAHPSAKLTNEAVRKYGLAKVAKR